MKLFEGEYKIMELLWENEPVSAKDLSVIANAERGLNKNTTYTVIKKLIDKGFVLRSEPGFICTSLVKREEVRKSETESLIDRLYSGSKKAFFSAFLEDEALSDEEIKELRGLLEKR